MIKISSWQLWLIMALHEAKFLVSLFHVSCFLLHQNCCIYIFTKVKFLSVEESRAAAQEDSYIASSADE